MELHAKVVFLIAVASLSLVLCDADTLCVTKLPPRRGLLFSFLRPSNQDEIPLEYDGYFDPDTECIVYMDLKWDEDVQIQFAPFTFFQSPSQPSVKIIKVSDDSLLLNEEMKIITEITKMDITGNISSTFAIVYAKMGAPFIFTFRTTRARELACPDLESNFGSVSCSNGTTIGSECTFQCGDGLYPSPDMFDPLLPTHISERILSPEGYRFFSTCSLSEERRRPAWKPDALTQKRTMFGTVWESAIPNFWKCVDIKVVTDVCFGSRNEFFPTLTDVLFQTREGIQVYSYISPNDCHYPPKFLLSIFDEERDGNFTPSQPPPTVATTTATTSEMMPVGSSGFLEPPMVAGREAFEAAGQVPDAVDCSIYCKFDSSTGRFLPRCGNILDEEELIDCLSCRYTGSACAGLTAVA